MRLFTLSGIVLITLSGLIASGVNAYTVSAAGSAAGCFCLLLSASRREIMLWSLLLLALALLYSRFSLDAFVSAFAIAAEFGALMAAISFVGLAVRHSSIGNVLTAFLDRSSGWRRSVKTYAMGHGAGALLNLTGLVILAASTRPAPAASHSAMNWQTLLCLHRGFAFAPAWSPYSYFTPIILSTIPGASWPDLIIIAGCFVAPLALFTIRPNGNGIEHGICNNTALKLSHREQKSLVLATGFCLTFVLAMSLTKAPPRFLIHWVLPVLALVWAAAETTSNTQIVTDLKHHITNRLPALRFEILALFTAGFISAALVTVEAGEQVQSIALAMEHIFPAGWTSPLFALTAYIGIIILMMAGVNPVLFVGLMAGAVSAGTLSVTTALAVLIGAWGAFPTLSPFAAANMIVAEKTGLTGLELSRGPNRTYNFFVILITAAVIVLSALVSS